VKDIFKEDRIAKQIMESKKEEKKKQRRILETSTYADAIRKFHVHLTLTAKEIKVILQNNRQSHDSSIRSKVKELCQQFDRRQERLFDFQDESLNGSNMLHHYSPKVFLRLRYLNVKVTLSTATMSSSS
jgi:hypothetical protein